MRSILKLLSLYEINSKTLGLAQHYEVIGGDMLLNMKTNRIEKNFNN